MLEPTDVAVVVGIILLLSLLTVLLIHSNSPTRIAPADQRSPAQTNPPTPAGRKTNWFGWTKRRWFWWPVLALAATIAVFFAWQHLPPTSFPTIGAWGNSGNQSDAVSWWDWFFQSTETGIPGIPRWLLAVAGLLVAALLLLGKSPSANKAKHD